MNVLRNRWMPVIAVWAGVGLLTFWNTQTIDSIAAAQTAALIVQTELTFLKQNAGKLDRILAEHSRTSLEVDSVPIGMLSLNSLFSSICSTMGLSGFKMTTAPVKKGSEAISVTIAIAGALERIVTFLSTLEKHPYVQDSSLTVKSEPENGEARCELTLTIRCRVNAPPTEPNIIVHKSAL